MNKKESNIQTAFILSIVAHSIMLLFIIVPGYISIPGDTITLKCGRFLIPEVCCQRCGCPDCKYYLVRVGNKQQLIHKHLIVGKANRLFHLPF